MYFHARLAGRNLTSPLRCHPKDRNGGKLSDSRACTQYTLGRRVCIECTLRRSEGLAARHDSLKNSPKNTLSARSPDDSCDARNGYQAQVRALRREFRRAVSRLMEEDVGRSNSGTRNGETKLDTLVHVVTFESRGKPDLTRQPGAVNYHPFLILTTRGLPAILLSVTSTVDASSLNALRNYELGLIVEFNRNLPLYMRTRGKLTF